MKPLYDITKTFEANIVPGPVWEDDYPKRPTPPTHHTLLGAQVNSLFGVSACPLTHGARGIGVCSRLGYDILTYRSVRSIQWNGQVAPHWCYVDIPHQLTVEGLAHPVIGAFEPFANQEVSTANSFGIQSRAPAEWQKDFEVAKQSISSGQLLILSLMFTPETGNDVVEDAGVVAQYAHETSADVFEINLAHPNSGMKSLVYEDVATSVAICSKVKIVLGDRPLLAKVGYYKDRAVLKEFMKQTKGMIAGISSTNTYGMPVVDRQGKEVFPGRAKAGVSGAAVRNLSKEQAKTLVAYKKELGLSDFVVIGIGGVTTPTHIDEYLKLGVDAVQAAAGVWADPLLAQKYHESNNRPS